MNRRRLASALVLGLLAPLPLPHLDSYLPVAFGLFAAAMAARDNGPLYLALMTAVYVVYAAAVYGVLSLIARVRAPEVPPR